MPPWIPKPKSNPNTTHSYSLKSSGLKEPSTMKGALACTFVLTHAVAHLMAEPAHALTCPEVDTCLTPCIAYLTGWDPTPTPTPACCAGVNRLKTLGTTTADRQFACHCVKQAAAHLRNLKEDAVSGLPGKCGTPLPFPISLEYDCSKIPI